MTVAAIAVFGTASDVGKSVLTAAICRLLSDAGLSVAPYKAQNMSNNSYVAADGGEMGRAQYLQAVAARCEPSVHHNPVLLKPSADDSSQVIVHGQAVRQTRAREYFRDNQSLREAAFASLARLSASHDVVVLEGAGSCAEVNLRAHEFVNFPAAHAARARVILVADIDKGGVFAQVVGSLEVMPSEDRARVCGVIINKFRGDRSLFDDGVAYLEQRTGLPVLGVVPFLYGFDLDSEDAVPLDRPTDPWPGADAGKLKLAVLCLPHLSNFTDFDALAQTPSVAVHYIYRPRDLSEYSAVILPGTKSVAHDLEWLRRTGLADRVLDYHARGGRVVGICGGLQLMGRRIDDPEHLESNLASIQGLGLVDAVTRLCVPKVVRRVAGRLLDADTPVAGYEIHLGRTEFARRKPLLNIEVDGGRAPDGFRDDARRLWGTYLHGLFDEPQARHAFLGWVDPSFRAPEAPLSRAEWLDRQLDAFAAHVRQHIAWPTIEGWVLSALGGEG